MDDSKHIYLANPEYKTEEFQHKHKFALLKILMDQHKKYKQNGYIFELPDSIVDRTNSYLELSCSILQWFKSTYQKSELKTDCVKLKDVYELFVQSDYYVNLSKVDKKKYTKSYFIEYFKTNIFLRKYYSERYSEYRNIVKGWTLIINDD